MIVAQTKYGDSFGGNSPLTIIKRMMQAPHTINLTVRQYVSKVSEWCKAFEGKAVRPRGRNDKQLAKSLLRELNRVGLLTVTHVDFGKED